MAMRFGALVIEQLDACGCPQGLHLRAWDSTGHLVVDKVTGVNGSYGDGYAAIIAGAVRFEAECATCGLTLLRAMADHPVPDSASRS